MEEEYDEELEKLLGEIPRATSAPPHLEELQTTSEDANQTPTDEGTHRPSLYSPFREASPSSSPSAYKDLSPYRGLPSDNYGMAYTANMDMAKEQSLGSTDPGITSDRSLLRSSSSGHLPSHAEVNKETVLLEKELHKELHKLTLVENGLSYKNQLLQQPPGMPFPSPVQGAGGGQLSENKNTSSRPAMQLGSPSSLANGGVLLPSAGSLLPPQHPYDMRMVYDQRMQEFAAAAAASQQQPLEESVFCRQRMKEEFLLRQRKLQEQQARFYASLQCPMGPEYLKHHPLNYKSPPTSSCMYDILQQSSEPKAASVGGPMSQILGSTHASPLVVSGETPEASAICRYFLQGLCTRGDLCPFFHPNLPINHQSISDKYMISEADVTLKGQNGLNTPRAISPAVRKRPLLANSHACGHLLSNGIYGYLFNGTHLSSPCPLSSMSGGDSWKGSDHEVTPSVNMKHLAPHFPPPPPKYTTLKEVEGHIYGIAKDQHGCRFLQRKFEEGVFEDVQKIFVEIVDYVSELMMDPFGNYLVQKLLEVCDEAQRMEILYKVTGKGQLVTIALNMHGTRAVQKLIETLNTPEQVRLVVSSLKEGVVTLIKDLNGNHVVQRCLQRLSGGDSQFIFDAAACHCVEIATHRHGCCVLQRCIDFSCGQQRDRLISEITAHALVLSQDPFGNYVVQYILDLGLTWAIAEVVSRLDGNFEHLSMQKFSSNVVEKCLKLSGEESKARIIREIMGSARLAQLLQDPFANYVVQCALTVSKGALHARVVEAIRPHVPALRSSPYGKRILARSNLKK